MFAHVKQLSLHAVYAELNVFFVEQYLINDVDFVVVRLDVLQDVRVVLLHNKLNVRISFRVVSAGSDGVHHAQNVSIGGGFFCHINLKNKLVLNVQKLHAVKYERQELL